MCVYLHMIYLTVLNLFLIKNRMSMAHTLKRCQWNWKKVNNLKKAMIGCSVVISMRKTRPYVSFYIIWNNNKMVWNKNSFYIKLKLTITCLKNKYLKRLIFFFIPRFKFCFECDRNFIKQCFSMNERKTIYARTNYKHRFAISIKQYKIAQGQRKMHCSQKM